jgi:hypothetical protein
MTAAAPLHVAGHRLMLDPSGAAWCPASRTLIVSDLHLEKGSAYAQRGSLVPPLDTRLTLERLTAVVRNYGPVTVIALGDSFHDNDASVRLQAADRDRLARLTTASRFVWVLGNHDAAPRGAEALGGAWVAEYTLGPLLFRHQAQAGAAPGEVCGHHHPKARVPARGGTVSRPCFVADGRRLMLPAFGAYTGGLDVADPAIARLFPRGGRAFLLGRDRLFSFALGAASR